MNTNRLLIGLVVAMAVALLFSTFVYRQFKQATNMKPVATQNLVVAAVPLQLGARLDATIFASSPGQRINPLPGCSRASKTA